jgi:acetolactate decarboxylase
MSRFPNFEGAASLVAAAVLIAGCERTAPPTNASSTLAAAASTAHHPAADTSRDQLTQVSIINALMLGQYDGVLPLATLLQYGNFGVGTCDHLDGELIVLDGVAWQARADGTVRKVDPGETTPFAVVTPFEAEGKFACQAASSLEELESQINRQLPGPNAMLAVRISARFKSVHLRSVPRQEPPYQPLADVAKKQATWTRENVAGTLVGIRCPAWTASLNVPGYHWHFISDDRKLGGHVVDCAAEGGEVAFDTCDSWLIKLSDKAEFVSANVGKDLRQELERVERPRGK